MIRLLESQLYKLQLITFTKLFNNQTYNYKFSKKIIKDPTKQPIPNKHKQ